MFFHPSVSITSVAWLLGGLRKKLSINLGSAIISQFTEVKWLASIERN
jgi:hypothetical protein